MKEPFLKTGHILSLLKEAGMLRIGGKIASLRTARGWKQEDLAKKLKTTAPNVSRWEAGRIIPSAEALAQLAKVFDVTVDYFLFEDVPLKPRGGFKDEELAQQLGQIDTLDDEARLCFKRFIRAIIAEQKVKEALAHGT